MPRKPDAAVAERNSRIVTRIQAGESVSDVASDYGLDPSTVYHLLRGPGVKATPPRPEDRDRARSQLHVRVGATISAIRIFQKKMDMEPFAKAVGLSSSKVSRLERGAYDLTLSEAEKVASYCGVSLVDLLTKPSEIQQRVSCRAA